MAVDWGVALTIAGGGINMGKKYLLPKNFTAEWSFGLAYLSVKGDGVDLSGPGPRVGIKVGYVFKSK